MHFNKTILTSSIVAALGITSFSAQASLTSSVILDFTLGTQQTVACNYGTTPPCGKASFNITDIVGSYFGIDLDNTGIEKNEKTPIGAFNGIHMGTIQPAAGGHAGWIDGSENPNIDNPWTYFGGTGMHQTTSPITDLTGAGTVRTLDFSGWNIVWNGIPSIPLIDLGTTITCDNASCSHSSNYTLDGSFNIVGAGLTDLLYTLHLEGTVIDLHHPYSVPVPTAAWLFGSGLAGLAGVARRRKSATVAN